MNLWTFITDPNYRAVLGDFVKDRVLPTLAGVGIGIVGVAFILSGTKAAETAGDLVETAAKIGTKL